MSLKVCIDQKGGRQTVTMTGKDRKKRNKDGKRKSGDLRAVISSKGGRDRDDRRTKDPLAGDLRERLEKHRGQVDTKEFVEFVVSKAMDDCDPLDPSSIGKQKLLSMYLDEKDSGKDSKGKENATGGEESSNKVKSKKEEKTLTSEWGQRKKKKKKKSRSRSKSDRRPLIDKEYENRKRKHSPVKEEIKEKRERRKTSSRERDSRRKRDKKDKSLSRDRQFSKDNRERRRSVSKEIKGRKQSPLRQTRDRRRSLSREIKDRRNSVSRDGRGRRRSLSREVKDRKHSLRKLSKERRKSISKDRRRSVSKVKKRSVSKDLKETKKSPQKNRRSMSRDLKEVSGRKYRIDSGISTGTNFSKESGGSVSISPEQSPRKEASIVDDRQNILDQSQNDIHSSRGKSLRKDISPKRDRKISPKNESTTRDDETLKMEESSRKSNEISETHDEFRVKDGNENPEIGSSVNVNKDADLKPKELLKKERERSFSPSPSPPRRVLERPEDELGEHKQISKIQEEDQEGDISLSSNEPDKNPYSVYEEKHGKRQSSRRRSKEPSDKKKDKESKDHEEDSKKPKIRRDLKDEIDYERRRRMRRSRSRSRGPRSNRRMSDEFYRYGRRDGRYNRYPPRSRRYSGSPGPRPESWEDKVESFLQNTSGHNSSLVTITTGTLPQDFDPSRPPPGVTAVVPPDYALSEYTDPALVPTLAAAPVRQLTDVTTGQLIPQPALLAQDQGISPYASQQEVTQPPPDYQQTVDITITRDPQKVDLNIVKEDQELAAMNQLNQENEKSRKENKPLTQKEKKKLEKGQKEIWQFVAKKLLTDPVFCTKVKKKKSKSIEDLREKGDKCAIRIGLKLEKSGFSETRLWKMLKDNEKGIQGFYDELTAAVLSSTIEIDVDARKPKDRLDAELLKDGTVFKYIGQYIQANPFQERLARKSTTPSESELPTTNDLQSILQHFTTADNTESVVPETEQDTSNSEPQPETAWDFALRSFVPLKSYLEDNNLISTTSDAYVRTLVLSGFNHLTLSECVLNFQPPAPVNPGEPPETLYGHLLDCLREISFERYPMVIQENIDTHTVNIVKMVMKYFKPEVKSPSPVPEVKEVPKEDEEEVVPKGGNTTNQLAKKKYITVSVSVDTIPVENKNFVWQICLHTPGLPEEEDPDYECMMVPNGISEVRLAEAGFMFNQEKQVWYHQGTEFGRRKAESEEKSVEKLVNYLEELRSGGRGAGLNNGLILLFECTEDLGLVRSLLSSHSADIWSDTVRGVGCIDHYVRQADLGITYCPPYFKYSVGTGEGGGTWLTSLVMSDTGKTVKIEADTRAEIVYSILERILGQKLVYENFTRWYCYPSMGDTVGSLARDLELIRQLLPLQTHVDRQLFNARVQCVLEGVYAPRSELEQTRPCACVARQAIRRLVNLGFNMDNLKNSFRADPGYEIPANVFLQDMTQVQRLRVHAQTDYVRKFIKEYFTGTYFNK